MIERERSPQVSLSEQVEQKLKQLTEMLNNFSEVKGREHITPQKIFKAVIEQEIRNEELRKKLFLILTSQKYPDNKLSEYEQKLLLKMIDASIAEIQRPPKTKEERQQKFLENKAKKTLQRKFGSGIDSSSR